VTLDPNTGRVHWATEPCGDDDAAGAKPCLGSLTSIQLLRQQTLGGPAAVPPACRRGGVGFSLDPDDPQDPLGKFFRKRFFPEECADLWSDLLPGAVLFQADWDLKLLLHNVDGAGDGLPGEWYKPIEAWYREEPVPLGQETLGKVWLVAEAVEAAETPLGLALGEVALRLKAAAVRRDPASPTGLVVEEMEEEEDGRRSSSSPPPQPPPPRALARFVEACNAHMPELVAHFPSFGFLQQLVLAQEAARFLRDRGVALPVDPGLAALRSPLTGMTRVPALQLERRRLVTMAGVVGLSSSGGESEEEEAAVWLRGLGPVALGAGSTAIVGLLDADATASSTATMVRSFSCGVRNTTLRGLGSLDALFRGGAALDCKAEWVVFDPFGGARAGGPTEAQAGGWGEDDVGAEWGDDDDACGEALAVWSEQLEAWRVWASRPLPPPLPSATVELVPTPLGRYNVTGRVVLLEEAEAEAGGSEGLSDVVVLAWEGQQVGRVEAAVRRLNATALLLVTTATEDDGGGAAGGGGGGGGGRRGRGRAWRKKRAAGGTEEDALVRALAARLPVRLLAPEVGEELRAMARLSALEDEDEDKDEGEGEGGVGRGLRVWLACGVERNLGGDGAVEEGEEEEDGPREVVHDGVEYRTLDLAVIAGQRRGCQMAPLPLPAGFEIAPAFPDVVDGVVKPHPWATTALLLRATDASTARVALPPSYVAYTTASGSSSSGSSTRAGERLDFGSGLMVINATDDDNNEDGGSPAGATTYRPLRCDARVLLRRVVTTVAYGGYLYRALDPDVAVHGIEVPPGPPPDFEGLAAARARLPVAVGGELGWEVSPADRGVAQKVAAAHPWATDVLILADGKGYPTQLYYHRKAQLQRAGGGGESGVSPVLVPHHRVLIRRPLPSSYGSDAGATAPAGAYRVSDAYRADASARLSLRRLGKGEGERGLRCLLEVEVAERVMIHGGVDLSGVRRVPLPGGGGGGGGGGGASSTADAQLLVALERAAAEGRLDQGGLWREGDRTYSVLSMAGMDDGEEGEDEEAA
jgi:hypothetical protein